MDGYFITGTDTGSGKTFVTCALLEAFRRRGVTAAPMKPVAAGTMAIDGVHVNEDVALMIAASGMRFPRHCINPYCFDEAIAPHIAARHQGIVPDLAVIATAARELSMRADCVLVEGAGGFLVPLSDEESMARIPALLGLPVILVVGMKLGCLNHALLTAEAIRARGLALAGWVANTPGERMSAYDENLATLKRCLPAHLLGEIARLEGDTLAATRAAADMLNLQPLTSPESSS